MSTNAPEKYTPAEKKSFWQSFKEMFSRWRSSENMRKNYGLTLKNATNPFNKPVPKAMLRTPANYYPAGMGYYKGQQVPMVWLNGTRFKLLPETAERYHPPVYDKNGDLVRGPYFDKVDRPSVWQVGTELAKGAAAAGLAWFTGNAANQAGFQRGARAGYQRGYYEGANDVVDAVTPN